jgi:hypothetical protein
MVIPDQPQQIVCETAISKITRARWTGGGSSGTVPVLQVQSLELKPQSHQNKQKTTWKFFAIGCFLPKLLLSLT